MRVCTNMLMDIYCDFIQDSPGRMPIDSRVLAKLKDLVKHAEITDTVSVEQHLKEYVLTTLYTRSDAPPPHNKRLFPEHKTIYNYIYSTLAEEL